LIEHFIIANGIQRHRIDLIIDTGLQHPRAGKPRGSLSEIEYRVTPFAILRRLHRRSSIANVCYSRRDNRSFSRIAPGNVGKWRSGSKDSHFEKGRRGYTHSTTRDSTIMFSLGVTRLYRDLAAGVPDCEASARGIRRAEFIRRRAIKYNYPRPAVILTPP